MAKIKCPKCGEVIEISKDTYNSLLSEIESEELSKRVEAQVELIKKNYESELALAKSKDKADAEKELSSLKSELKVLQEKLNNKEKDIELAVTKSSQSYKEELSKKDKEIYKLQDDVKDIKKDSLLNQQKLKEQYDFALKAKDEEIKHWKEFRMKDSTKDLGESLEQYCENKFNELRTTAFENAYFEKDNDVVEGSKGDYLFRDFSNDNIEIVSIMFEMKNQKDDTEHKHKNEDFFKKLDKDRNQKGCEYAVLVSTLEEDSELYNRGIVDVSYRYPKMFVIRPEFFITIISLIRNMAKSNFEYKKQVITYQRENVDITNFEEAVKAVADKINNDYEKAGAIYSEVDKMCDDIVKKVENFRKEFKTAAGWIEKAKNQLPNLEVRKLTRGNKTMKEKFEKLEEE